MYNHILITDKNHDDFKGVLPPGLSLSPERIALGCYEDDGRILGALSLTLTAFEYDIDWLYVVPDSRRKGIATGLMKEFFDFIKRTGEVCPVSASFEVTPDEQSLYSFFLTVEGMDVSYSHPRYYVKHKELVDSKELKKELMVQFDEKLFLKLDKAEQEKILNEVRESGVYAVKNYESWQKSCVPELCRVMYLDGKAEGTVFVLWRPDGNLEFSYIQSNNPVCTKSLINRTAADVLKFYSGCSLVFDTVVQQAEKIAGKLFPDMEPVDIYKAEW